MKKKLISIIIPTYNRSTFIKNISIPSVINQKYTNWELIIVDDGSNDDTKLVSDYFVKLDKRISYIYKDNGGQGSARNLGIKLAKGDYVLMLDSDDFLLSDALEKLSEFLDRNEQIDFVGCKRWVFNCKKGIFDVNASNPSCILYRKKLFYDFCFYSEDKKLIGIEDSDLSISWDILSKYKRVNLIEKKINIPLVVYLEHPGQATNRFNLIKLRKRTFNLLEKYLDNKYVSKEELALRSKELGNFDLELGDIKNGRSNFIKSLKFNFNTQALFFLIMSYGGFRFYYFLLLTLKTIREKIFWRFRLFYYIIKYNIYYKEAKMVTTDYSSKINFLIMKKIGINLMQYTDIQGIEVYTQNILQHLIAMNQDINFIIFANEISAQIFNFNYPNVKIIIKKFRKINKWKLILYQQTGLLFKLFFEKVNFLYCPSLAVPIFYKKKIVTIHDCAFVRFKEEATFLSRLYLRIVFLSVKYFSIKIVTISNFSKQEIMELFSINKDKLVLIYEAAPKLPDISEAELEQVLEKFNLKDKKYFFYIGNMRPRKNIKRLLEAWDIFYLKNSDYFLVLAGKNDYGIEGDNNKKIILTGIISDAEKVALYKKSIAFVFPTLYEGFGLPALEAQFLGTPLIASNISSLSEVAGSAAVFIDPYDSKSIVTGLEKVISPNFNREELIKDGFTNCQKFSWEKAAKELSQLIKNIYEQKY